MKIVTAAEMHHLEEESARLGVSLSDLMEHAGRAVAQAVRQELQGAAGRNIVILAGPGNNGGDGLVAARYLYDWGADVSVYLPVERSENDPNLRLAREKAINIETDSLSRLAGLLASAEAAVDAVFGTGQNRELSGVYKETLENLQQAKKARHGLKVFAVDLPSGLNADTGMPDPATPFVDYTLTLGLPKRGLYTPEGAARAGRVEVMDIGLPPQLGDSLKTELIMSKLMQPFLPERSAYAHKGSFGRVLVIAGSANYPGAAFLSCAGAARTGAGLVTLAAAKGVVSSVSTRLAEAVYIPLSESTHRAVPPEAAELARSAQEFDAVLVGPGLGQRPSAVEFVNRLFDGMRQPRLVLDADALNILARIPEWWRKMDYDAVLTPHPGEMGRLSGISAAEVQAGRIELAARQAAAWCKTVVLKGAYTVIAAPDERCRISPFANAGLASAGTGDVLAGTIAGLLAQGLSLFDAASLGVYLHAMAGESVKERLGDTGILASDLLPELPRAIRELKQSPIRG